MFGTDRLVTDGNCQRSYLSPFFVQLCIFLYHSIPFHIYRPLYKSYSLNLPTTVRIRLRVISFPSSLMFSHVRRQARDVAARAASNMNGNGVPKPAKAPRAPRTPKRAAKTIDQPLPPFEVPHNTSVDHPVQSMPPFTEFNLKKAPKTRHTTEFMNTYTEDTYILEVPSTSSSSVVRPLPNELTIDVRSRTVSDDTIQRASHSREQSPLIMITKPLPRVLLLHTGGTLGMDPDASDLGFAQPKGAYQKVLQPGKMLSNIKAVVPELSAFANLDLEVVMNADSCRIGPRDWVKLAQILEKNRNAYDAFLIVHGTDTMAYTASALSLMLLGFRKPIVMTGSQLPLTMPRSDARQNLIDSLTCATAAHVPPHVHLQEVAICFGGRLLRGNRSQKVNSSAYQAFDSPGYAHLATLGVDVEWKEGNLLRDRGVFRPRYKLNPNVIRVPIVPGCDPRIAYGDLYARGIRGIVLEAFGVGNMPDTTESGWIPWLKDQKHKGLKIYLASQCRQGPLHPELYRSGSSAVDAGLVDVALTQMTPECAVVKMMLLLEYPEIPMGVPLAGEL